MTRFSTLFLRLSAAATTAILVAACGGGGGSTTLVTDPGQTPVQQPVTPPAGGNAGAGTPAAPQLLAQYQGTWTGGCTLQRGRSGNPIGSIRENAVIGAPAANGASSFTVSDVYYAATGCVGTVVAVVTQPTFTAVAVGTKTVGTVTAVLVNASIAGGTPTFTGPGAALASCAGTTQVVVTLGTGSDIFYLCTEIAQARNVKTILSSVSTSDYTTFDFGDDEGALDAQGFPETFLPERDGRYYKD